MVKLTLFQKGFNYSQDGTGNRLVYHVQGCNLRCPWCSNPEGMPFTGPDTFAMTAKQLLNEALRSKAMFFDGGGVTFTGGEATCQFGALKDTLTLLWKTGISTALETNGTSSRLPELFPLLTELIMDFKHPDSRRHRGATGMGNELIRNNLIRAFKEHPNLLVRIPLIGGFNASLADMEQFVVFFTAQDPTNARFELLSYHEYGKDKWAKCGRDYTVANAFVPEETHKQYEAMMRSQGLHIVRT